KLFSADGSWGISPCESRTSPSKQRPADLGWSFSCLKPKVSGKIQIDWSYIKKALDGEEQGGRGNEVRNEG
ncbi:hypothetical protein D0463_15950, partial [Bacillus sp. V59.32b]